MISGRCAGRAVVDSARVCGFSLRFVGFLFVYIVEFVEEVVVFGFGMSSLGRNC